MKAAIFYRQASVETSPLKMEDVDKPDPKDDEVLIKVRACAVCRTDLHILEGDLQAIKMPLILGHQAVGTVEDIGSKVTNVHIGERVGVPWLYWSCGACKYCRSSLENLCDRALFTGYSVNGGYAEYMLARDGFVHKLPNEFDDAHVAPLLCGGAIGYRALKLTGLLDRGSGKLGVFGFGSAGHLITPVAIGKGLETYVFTRGSSRQELARELGAKWTGQPTDDPGVKLDAAVVFAPAGWIVIEALKKLDKAGRVVIGEIHMSPIERLDYNLIWLEREIKSVANVTRDDVKEYLKEAVRAGIKPDIHVYSLEEANRALKDLKQGSITGSAVLKM